MYAQRVENAGAQYEGILGVLEHERNMIEEYIAQSEAQGHAVSGEYYTALIGNQQNSIAQLEQQKSAMLAEFQKAMESGTIEQGSEAWYEMVASIDEVTLAIEQGKTKMLEYEKAIEELNWEKFDMLQDRINAITDESNFLIELLSSEDMYDDNGQLTEAGMATMGLRGQNYNTHMAQADQAAAEAARIKAELEKDPFNTDLLNRYNEMIALQQEHILAAQGEKEAVRDMVEEGINLELDALQERIDKYNESLNSQKDLYEYQKKVKKQTEEIASIEKQIAAYRGDNSEEAKQKVQKLEVDLENAQEELKETEYERYISDQQKLLDELYLEYEEILNTRLDNIDALFADTIDEINSSAAAIGETIESAASSVGYTLSDSMQSIWTSNAEGTMDVLATYGEEFSSAQTTTNNTLNTINTNLQNMISQLNVIANTNIEAASTSSAANSPEANATPPEEPDNTTDSNTPAPETTKEIKIGGKINAEGAKIYDYAGDTSGERQYYRNDPIYTVISEKNGYLKVRYHKLSSGVTGWFKKSDVKAYASGKKDFINNEIAWTQENGKQEFIVRPSDGAILTPIARRDSVLNAAASSNIWKMANSPAEFIMSNLNIGSTHVPNNSDFHNNYTQHLDNVVFNFPNVKNYEDMLSAMQKDRNFERLIQSMTIDMLAGKSGLAKGKAIR